MLLIRLAGQALGGTLASDECFHAYVAEWISAHGRLPAVLPELYSGFFYYYQPLLHLIGAAWIALFGAHSLLALPVTLDVLLLATLALGAVGLAPGRAGRWAALLVFTNPSVASMAVRLYVEPLVTWLFVLAVGLLFLARRSARVLPAVVLGLTLGLALLSKFNAWVLVLGVGAVALWDFGRGRHAVAARLGLACGIAALMTVPWLIRNQLLFGSALYPAFAPDLDHALYALNVKRFSTPTPVFLASIPIVVGPALLGLAGLALLGAALARRWTLRESVLVGSLAAMALTAFVPLSAARHLNPFIAILAVTAAASVAEFLDRRGAARLLVSLAIAGFGVYALATLPDHRRPADPPAFLAQAMPEIAARTPANARILSLWTYDTFYDTRRAATWPNPWGQRDRPIAMFYDTDPDSMLIHLRRSGITHVLATVQARGLEFDSANYPDSFLRVLGQLVQRGTTPIRWMSRQLILIEIPPG